MKKIILLFSLFSFFVIPNPSKVRVESKEELSAKYVVDSYRESIMAYCEKYEAKHRFFMETDLLIDPNTNSGNDLFGLESKDYQANYYYILLQEKNVRISYNNDFLVKTCTVEGKSLTGVILEKTITYQDGYQENRKDFLELVRVGSAWRINVIASDLFYDLSKYECLGASEAGEKTTNSTNYNADNCAILNKAELAYKQGNRAEALQFFQAALACAANKTYVEKRIESLKTLENFQAFIQKADADFEQNRFEEALLMYQAILKNGGILEKLTIQKVELRIGECRKEILYHHLVEDGNAYFNQGLYENALDAYNEASALKPTNSNLRQKVKKCLSFVTEEAKDTIRKEINKGTKQIEAGDYEKGLAILIKYRDSGLLTGKQLFYMAQIMDNRPSRIKRKFELKNKDCCVLTRQFAIEARNLGMSTDDFEYFWQEHLSDKSKSCI